MIKRLIMPIFGIIAIGLGIFVLISDSRLEKVCTSETTGTVVGILRDEEIDTEGYTSIVYSPQIEYKAGEKLVTFKGNGSSNASDYTIGEQIQIMYNPENIEEHIIKGDNSSKIGSIIWIVLGAVLLIVGLVKLIIGK